MTDNENPETEVEKVESSEGEPSSPPLDFGDLRGTGEAETNFESTTPNESADDEELIELSDEEVQQEFEEMDKEELEASESPKASDETESSASEEDNKSESLELSSAEESETVAKEMKIIPTRDTREDSAPEKIEPSNPESETNGYSQLTELFSKKIVYGSVAAALIVSAGVMLLISTFGSEEAETETTAAVDEEPFPFVTIEPVIEAEQADDDDDEALQPEIDTDELALLEAEISTTDEQIEDADIADETVLNAAETEITEQDSELIDVAEISDQIAATTDVEVIAEEEIPLATESESIASEETPEVTELAEVATDELEIATEETETGFEETQIVSNEQIPITTETALDAEPVAREDTAVLSAQVATDLITLTQSTNNYYIIVASFNSEELALKHASTLPENLETAIIIPPFQQDGKFRVAIAGYETMAEAQTNIASYKTVYGDDIWPLRYAVVNRGSVLNERSGNTYVVVSSFLTESSARNHISTLTDDAGVEPLIIPPFGRSKSYRVSIFSYETLTAAQQALPRHKEKYGDDIWLLKY